MALLQIDGLPTSIDVIKNVNPENGLYIYGFLVLGLIIIIYYLWKDKKNEVDLYRKEVKDLRLENTEQVKTMLDILGETIPILTRAADALKGQTDVQALVFAELEKLKRNQEIIIKNQHA